MCLLYTGGGDGTLGFKVIWGCTSPEILYDKKYLFLSVYWKTNIWIYQQYDCIMASKKNIFKQCV